MTAILTFDEPTHTYRWGGAVVRSVTQCLEFLVSFGMVDEDTLQAAKDRGTYVHDLCVADDSGDLDEPRVPDEYIGYLRAWRAFRHDYGVTSFEAIEEKGYSPTYGFAGTVDRRCRLGKVFPGARFQIDIKSSAQMHDVWGMQLAAYRQIACETHGFEHVMDRRASVRLAPDGRYKFDEWSDPQDWPAFQALLKLIRWSKK